MTRQRRANINLAKASKLIDDKSSLKAPSKGRRKSAFADDEEILVKALHESAKKGQTYREAMEALHGVAIPAIHTCEGSELRIR